MNASRSGCAQRWPGLIERGSAGGWDEAHAHSSQRCLDAVLGRELVLDVGDMDRGRLLADEEPLGDLAVGAALADESQDLDFAAGQGRATTARPAFVVYCAEEQELDGAYGARCVGRAEGTDPTRRAMRRGGRPCTLPV